MNQIEIIAKQLHETYCAAIGGKTVFGDPIPEWSELRNNPSQEVCAKAWLAMAERAVNIFNVKHEFWGAGEPDCPKNIKAANGNLHSLLCKRCGVLNPRTQVCIALIG